MIPLPFSNQIGESYSPQSSKETLINMFAEVDPGRAKIIRRQRPCLSLEEGDAAGVPRGIEKLQGAWWLVVGTTFYKWDETTLTTIGSINTAVGPVTMATNNNGHIALCDGADLWNWNGTTLTQVTESGFTPDAIDSLGGYGIMQDATTKGRFYTTALNDFTSINALDFANAESRPDDVVRIFVLRGEAWMLGESTIEVYRLGGSSFPLAKVTGSEIERGCGAKFSVATDDNSIFWLGDDFVVYKAENYAPARISTHAVEQQIAKLTNAQKAAAEAFFIQVAGNKFYTIRFPNNLTLQYNVATQLWNKCETYLYDDWQMVGSAGRSPGYVLTVDGICSLSTNVNKDISTTVRRVIVSPPIYNNGNRFVLYSYFLDCEVGRSSGDAPTVMLEVSRDGETWGNILTRTMGAVGEYRRRVVWRKLGVAREMQFRLAMTDDAPFKVMGSGGNVVAVDE